MPNVRAVVVLETEKMKEAMLLVTHTSSTGALSATKCCLSYPSPLRTTNPFLFCKTRPKFLSTKPLNLTVATADLKGDSTSTTSASATKQPFSTSNPPSPSLSNDSETVLVGEESVPLEGVIQFDKPNSSSQFKKWGRVGLLASGDVLALLLFSAIGRFSHGFPVLDIETLKTADPFIAGWFLGAYFLGGYGDDGRGTNGFSKALIASVKSWGVGIPLGLVIRAATAGHIPPFNFVLVTMGSTAVVLVGWRALLYAIFPSDTNQKDDDYRRGNPFELFELLTSLVRRW